MHPASAAPAFSDSTARAESAPNDIPEMFTTDAGRNAFSLSRGPPSTLAD